MARAIVTCRVRTRASRAWVRVCQVLQFLVGRERAERWAVNGARRLMRVDVISMRFAK